MYVAVRAVPLTWTMLLLTRFVPVIVTTLPGEPTETVDGSSEVIVGSGLSTSIEGATAAFAPLTVMVNCPDTLNWEPGTTVVSCVELTNVVATVAPEICITLADVKFVPVTVTVTGPDPTFTFVGAMDVTVGVTTGVEPGEEAFCTEPLQPIRNDASRKQSATLHQVLIFGMK
jgi:hypothetical protein